MPLQPKHSDPPDAQSKVRASVSLPRDVHAELERLARIKRVSLAWVIRDAAERYITDQKRAADAAP